MEKRCYHKPLIMVLGKPFPDLFIKPPFPEVNGIRLSSKRESRGLISKKNVILTNGDAGLPGIMGFQGNSPENP